MLSATQRLQTLNLSLINTRHMDDKYREELRRDHQLLANYLALWAWQKKVDCVVVPKAPLFNYLKISRMEKTRLNRLKADVNELFPHASAMYLTGLGSYANVYLSRVEFPSEFPWGSMSTAKRIERLARAGVLAAEATIPSEAQMITELALMTNGLKLFSPIEPARKPARKRRS